MPDTIESTNINIDPTQLKASDLPIFSALLKKFEKDSAANVLSKKMPHLVEVNGKMYAIQLKHSISKPYVQSSQSHEFYVRTKEKLGSGAYGSVKRALYRLKRQASNEGDTVSVLPGLMVYKRMKPEEGETYENLVKRAQKEVDALNNRYHLNIGLIEKTNQKSVHFFAPFVPGKLLSSVNNLTLDKRLSFVRRQFHELNMMHTRKNIVHLDVKPDNIIVTEFGLWHVDYGMSHDLSQPLNTIGGTEGYVDPALVAGKKWRNQGQESNFMSLTKGDVYSSGITACEIITEKLMEEFSEKKPVPGVNIPDFEQILLNKEQANQFIEESAKENKELSNILTTFIDIVTYEDPEDRASAEQAEMIIGLLTSKFFTLYLHEDSFDFKAELHNESNLKKYSLQDLFYLSKYSTEYVDNQDKTNGIVGVLFTDVDSPAEYQFSDAILESRTMITDIYQKAMSVHLNDFATQLMNANPNGNNPTITNLTQFIRENKDYNNEKIEQLAELIGEMLSHAMEVKSDEIKGVPVTTTVFNLDPFILEKISPALLMEALTIHKALEPKVSAEIPVKDTADVNAMAQSKVPKASQTQENSTHAVFQQDMAHSLNDLVIKLKDSDPNKSNSMIVELIQFIEKNNNTNKMSELVEKIGKFLSDAVMNPDKTITRTNFFAITKILNLSPFILEKIPEEIVTKAKKFNMNFQEKMNMELKALVTKLDKFNLMTNYYIKDLVQFINVNNNYDIKKITQLANKIEKVLSSDEVKKNLNKTEKGMPIITNILNLDSAILGKISKKTLAEAGTMNDNFQKNMIAQLKKLAIQLSGHIRSNNGKTNADKNNDRDRKLTAVSNLIRFIVQTKTYNDTNLNLLTVYIDNVIQASSQYYNNKISLKGSSVITMILNTLDPFIINQLPLQTLKLAHEAKAGVATHFISTFFFRKGKEKDLHSYHDSEGEGIKGSDEEYNNTNNTKHH